MTNLFIFTFVFCVFVLSCFRANDTDVALQKLTWIILGTAFAFIIISVKPNKYKISWAIVLSGLVQALIAIEQFINQKVVANKWLGIASQDPETLGVPVVQMAEGRWLRAFGSLPHPNMLAGFLVVSLILILGLAIYRKPQNANSHRKLQRYTSIIFVVTTVGLMTTLSRAGIGIFVVAILFSNFLVRKDHIATKQASKFALIALFIIILFSFTYSDLILQRTFSLDRIESQSNLERISQYDESWQIIKANWLLGTGPGNYVHELAEMYPDREPWTYQPVHNTYLLVIAETGLLGILLVIAFFYFLFKKFWSAVKVKMPTSQLIYFVGLISIACLGLVDHYFWNFWSGIVLTALIIALNLSRTIDESKKTN